VRSILLVDVLRQAHFRLSAQNATHLPPDHGAEVAFAGRSNAGKSSALNTITGRKGLARVSKAPGRTRLINFFTIDDQHALVDLPGYGYAQVARSVRAGWDEMVGNYLSDRESLRGVILIMDCRHPLTDYDEALLEFCSENSLPVHVLLSKSDKLNKNDRLATLRAVRARLAERGAGASVQLFSALNGEGVEEAQSTLAGWLGITAKTADKKNPGNKGRDSGAFK
jgi:GTP-binding protein